jgi:hypothetical protein
MILAPPPEAKSGWDAADALAEGWDEARALELIAAAEPATDQPAQKATDRIADRDAKTSSAAGVATAARSGRRRKPQRDSTIAIDELCDLWHDANRIAHVSFPVHDHRENWRVKSHEFRMWLSGQFFEQTGGALGGQMLEDAIRTLEARAVHKEPLDETFRRVGYNGKMYLDLGDAEWRAVEIDACGWRPIERSPVRFLRSPSTRALPMPERGHRIEELRQFLNVKSDADFMLVVAWLVAALRHKGPFPILVVNGEQGSGKSFFSRC